MALPAGWARYTTDEGKEYYHNAQLHLTQWEPPVAASAGDPSVNTDDAEVYEYRPTSDLDLHQRFSDAETGRLVGMELEPPPQGSGHAAPPPDGGVALGASGGGSAPSSSGRVFGLGGTLVGGFVAAASAATSEDSSGITGYMGSALTYAQQFFDVSSDDVLKRLRLALVPYPPAPQGPCNEFRARPDFWGPFWIATTAVLFLAATGNFGRLLGSAAGVDFKADYGLVSVAATMIYGLLVFVPLASHFCGGVNFRQMLCVYGYSLAPTIPVSVLCVLPVEGLRWLAVLLGLVVSLLFLREQLLVDIAIEAPSQKWRLAALFCASQGIIFVVYRTHFFSFSSAR